MVNAGAGLRRCPFCEAEIEIVAVYCGSCGAVLVAQSPRIGDDEPSTVGRARRLAINRRTNADEPVVVWRGGDDAPTGGDQAQGNAAADDPGLIFDPIKIGPDTCSGCDSTAVFVVGGQAAVYSLEGCDDDWCYYENPQGIV
jgi:uncharacterized protein (UPF0212 family)